MTSRDQIVEQALSLSPEDRVFVADMLEQSLTSGGFATPEIAAAWAVEIEQRLAAYDRGEIQAIGADASLDRLRRHVEQHRARKASS
jgi:Putative addiction module component